MDTKVEYKDDFVANLKERFQKNNMNQNEELENVSNNNISSNNQNNQDLFTNEEFGFKLGKLETMMQYCEAKINNEFSERNQLEQRFESKLENLLKDIDDLKNGYKSMTNLFTDSFTKIKTTLLENIDNKTESINRIISETNKKVSNLEDAVFNKKTENNISSNNNMLHSASNSYLFSTELASNNNNNNSSNNNISYNYSNECLSKRVNKLESVIYKNNSYPGREQEINTGLTKISHIERKLDNFLENYEKDMINMVNVIQKNDDNINELLTFKNVINDKFENLHKDFVETSKNNNKFNYQTTILLNETQRKLEDFEEFYKKNINEFQNLKNELDKNSSALNKYIKENLMNFNCSLSDISNNLMNNQKNFQSDLIDKNEKFIEYVEGKVNEFFRNTKNVQDNVINQFNDLKKNNDSLSNGLKETKNTFFHNLNEIEQYFSKKYDSLYRILNMGKIE